MPEIIPALLILKAFTALTVIAFAHEMRAPAIVLGWLALSVLAFCMRPWMAELGVLWYLGMAASDLSLLWLCRRFPPGEGFNYVLTVPLAWCFTWNIAAAVEFHTVYDGVYSVYPWAIQTASLPECFGLMAWAILTGSLTDEPTRGGA